MSKSPLPKYVCIIIQLFLKRGFNSESRVEHAFFGREGGLKGGLRFYYYNLNVY